LTERPVEREELSEPRRHAVVDGPVSAPGYRPRRRSRRGDQAERREDCRVPGYVADTLADVCGAGLVMVIGANASGVARIALTDAGRSRYARLGAHHVGRGDVAVSAAGPVVTQDPGWSPVESKRTPDARGSRQPAGHQHHSRRGEVRYVC
jgi:hypothetical protein